MLELKRLDDWIWTPEWNADWAAKARLVYFRKSFTLESLPEHCTVKVSADSRYKLYVNGTFATEGPSKSDTETLFADTVDLLPWLQTGENVISAEVLREPEEPIDRNLSLHRSAYACLWVSDEDLTGMPEGLSLGGHAGWKCRLVGSIAFRQEPHRPAPIKLLEDAVGNAAFADWQLPGFDDSTWPLAVPIPKFCVVPAQSPFCLQDRTIPPMQHTPRHLTEVVCFRDSEDRPVRANIADPQGNWQKLISDNAALKIPSHATVSVELSAGEETCGYLHYAFAGGKDASLCILTSECYAYPQPDGRPPHKGNRTDWQNGVLIGVEDTYAVSGFGTYEHPESYTPFWMRTFRFLRITVTAGDEPLTLLRLDYTETGYPLQVKTVLHTSDQELDRVWDISLRTLRRCMHETYFDCPFYEQLQYSMDTRSQMLFTYAVSMDDRLARRGMDDLRRSQRSDGLLNSMAPCHKSHVIPGFSIYYILMVHDHMMWFGDRKLVLDHLPCIDGILRSFERHIAENGMVGRMGGPIQRDRWAYWSFVDWSKLWNDYGGVPGATLKGTGALTAESLLYVLGLQKAAELNDWVGRGSTAQEYRSRADRVLAAIRSHAMDVWQSKHGSVTLVQDGPGVADYSVHCQVLAVLTGLVDAEQGRRMLEATVGDDRLPQASVSFGFYLFRAWEKVGLYEENEPHMWDLWRQMIRDHMTTCMENDTDGRSDCHAWAAPILYELPCVYLGLRPVKPGYAQKDGTVRLCSLQRVEGTVITPAGCVPVDVEKENLL